MSSITVDAPMTRRQLRQLRQAQVPGPFADNAVATVIAAHRVPLDRSAVEAAQARTTPSVTQSYPRPLVMPGVVDTRPGGMRVIDVRERDKSREVRTEPWFAAAGPQPGVVDNRPCSVTGEIPVLDGKNPPSPFDTGDLPKVSDVLAFDAQAVQARSAETTGAPDLGVAALTDAAIALASAPVVVPTSLVASAAEGVAATPVRSGGHASPYMRRSELRRVEQRASRRGTLRRGGVTIGIPQVGIVSALGLATIAAPLTGVLSTPAKAGANALSGSVTGAVVLSAPVVPVVAAPFPQTAPRVNAVEEVKVVVDDSRLAEVPDALAAPGRVLARTGRGGSVVAVLPGCDGEVSASAKAAANGNLPSSALCTLWVKDESLRADAAVDLAILNVAYRQEFGRNLCIIDGYRSLSEQYTVKRLRGGFAAAPGYSKHGVGIAIDLCGGSGVVNTSTYQWLSANGSKYGWSNPEWAKRNGSGPFEPWHWEYFRGEGHSTSH